VPATPRGDDDRHRERSAGRDVVRRRPAVIRTTAAIGEGIADHASGHLRYVTKVGDGFVSGRHAFTAGLTAGFEIPSCEFLEAGHDA
jgi:hypothetical protein